jgi:hypothetical protein
MKSLPGTFKRIQRVKLKTSGKTDLLDYCERKDGRKAYLKLNGLAIQAGPPLRIMAQFRQLARHGSEAQLEATFDGAGCPMWRDTRTRT